MDLDKAIEDKLPEGHCAMYVMSHLGDKREIWNPQNDAEVASARRTFEDLKKKGYAAYKVTGKDGEKGELMHDFDPNAGKMIMAPAMQGG